MKLYKARNCAELCGRGNATHMFPGHYISVLKALVLCKLSSVPSGSRSLPPHDLLDILELPAGRNDHMLVTRSISTAILP